MTAPAFEEAPVHEVTIGLATEERVNVTLMGQTLLSPNPEPMWPGWEASQARPAVERRAEMMEAGEWERLYRKSARPEVDDAPHR